MSRKHARRRTWLRLAGLVGGGLQLYPNWSRRRARKAVRMRNKRADTWWWRNRDQ